ncbi:MAG TPA: FMN-binding negative transcriptional regulator [Gammaproteobacteria bacterium]|nr:FMN-binding negative transcriptional regulator [Gammaproteobacteria bacterium]
MYTPAHFKADDVAAMHALLRRHPFALLATHHDGELYLTHLPFHLDPARGAQGTLEAHLARANPHCAALQAGAASTMVFKGPDAYVSPRWYGDPAKNVPTWNYVAVHAHGRPRVHEDAATSLAYIGRLTDEHEAYIEEPWSVQEAQVHVERSIPHILAFEIPIERLEGTFKLSQNHPAANRAGVIRGLRKSAVTAAPGILELMDGLYEMDGSLRKS